MKKIWFFIYLTCGFFGSVQAQNQPAPAYLKDSNFPDSVLAVQLVNRTGGEVTFEKVLNEMKGTITLIDFWASWCPDCIKGLPELDALKKETKGKKINYLFLSVDKDDSKWQGAIDKFQIKGTHYRIPVGWKNALTNYIGLDWIPRYVLIDSEGTVLVPKAIHASDEMILEKMTGRKAD